MPDFNLYPDAPPITPDPIYCQVEGCGKAGQTILDLGARGAIRICLYHYVLVMFPPPPPDPNGGCQ